MSENNEYRPENGSYNDPNSLYHYKYSSQEEQPAWEAATKKKKNSIWKKSGVKVTALLLACALVGGGAGFGGAALSRSVGVGGGTAIHQSDRTVQEVTVKKVTGQTLMTPAEVYASTVGSVVSINCSAVSTNIFGQRVESASSGSGFVITQDGYIVTNHHVVASASSVKVTMYDGKEYSAAVVGSDSDYDVAVLKVETTGLQPVTLGNSADVNVGDTVLAIGNPLGELTFSMSQGIVSCCDRAINVSGTPFNMIQVDASINPGNSGGPLMNLYGEVVGIVSAKYSSYSNTAVEGLGFAIPIGDVQAVITDIMENGQITSKPSMGITAGTMTRQMATQYQIDKDNGVFVYSVDKGGAGEKAGLRMGDVITKVDSMEITSMEDLTAAKKGHRAGDTVTVIYYRDGQNYSTELTFDAKTESTQQEQQTPQNGQGSSGWGSLYDYFFGRR